MINPHNLVTEPESTALIRFQDCDPFGHLNNARYIDYFLNARQDHLIKYYNLRIYERDKPAQTSWVSKQTQIAYLRPALVMEEVRIRTRLIHLSETGVVVEGLMLDQEARHLKSIIWLEFAHISLVNGRVVNHPQDLMDLFRSVVIEGVYNPDGFNNRVEQARAQFRKRLPQAEAVAPGAEMNR